MHCVVKGLLVQPQTAEACCVREGLRRVCFRRQNSYLGTCHIPASSKRLFSYLFTMFVNALTFRFVRKQTGQILYDLLLVASSASFLEFIS
jgi:hypothetical protein